MARAAVALINLDALRHNLQRVREAAPGCHVMAIIKANGYGHGMVRVARALASADAFGVASIDEAIVLREAGIETPITLLEGFFEAQELALIQRYRLGVVIHHAAQLDILEAHPLSTPIPTWLKIDSGMHRLGFAPEKAQDAWRRLKACRWVANPIRLMTHLASADDRHSPQTLHQLECFNAVISGMEGERGIANSAGILGWPQTHADWVRPGIMLYGVSPFVDGAAVDDVQGCTNAAGAGDGMDAGGRATQGAVAGCAGAVDALKPVMTLTSKLISVNRFKKGDAIGYAASWVCPQDMPVGVVAIGYGDGYPRHAAPGTPVLVNGKRVPLIGRVSMDMVTVDLSSQPGAQIGDSVTLWGQGLPVEEVARCASTIPYQLLCGVTQRVRIVESGERYD